MKERLRMSSQILLLIATSATLVAFISSPFTNLLSRYFVLNEDEITERLSRETIDNIFEEMQTLADETDDIDSIFYHANAVLDRIDEVSFDQLLDYVQSEKISIHVKNTLVQLMRHKSGTEPIDDRSVDALVSLMLDETAADSLRINIIICLPPDDQVIDALAQAALHTRSEEVAFMAIKVLNARPESKDIADRIAEAVIADPKTMSRRLLAAMNVKAERYRHGVEEFTLEKKERYIRLALGIIDSGTESIGQSKEAAGMIDVETAAVALINTRDIDAAITVLQSERLDVWLKQVCVEQNYMLFTKLISGNPSVDDIRLAVDAANIWPVDEIVTSLEEYFLLHPEVREQVPILVYTELVPADKKMLEY